MLFERQLDSCGQILGPIDQSFRQIDALVVSGEPQRLHVFDVSEVGSVKSIESVQLAAEAPLEADQDLLKDLTDGSSDRKDAS